VGYNQGVRRRLKMKDKEQELLTRAEILRTHKNKDGFPLNPDREFYKRLCQNQIAKLKSLGYEQVWEQCPDCDEGLCSQGDYPPIQCSTCKGTGKVRIQFKLPEGIEQSIKDTLFDNGVSNRGHITRQILSLIRQDKE